MIIPNIHAGACFADLRIGLLGGSFNPAHAGHRAMSLYALKRLNLDQIWWLVSPQNPLKPAKGMAPLAERLEDARALAHHPNILVTSIEAQFGTRYTADTLAALKLHFPRTRFVWLMGADNLEQIPLWYQWEKIFAQVPVAIFRRPGYATGGKATQYFAAWRHPSSHGRTLAAFAPPAWLVLDNPLNLLSATAIRGQKTGG